MLIGFWETWEAVETGVDEVSTDDGSMLDGRLEPMVNGQLFVDKEPTGWRGEEPNVVGKPSVVG